MVKFIADSSCDMLEMEGVNFESIPMTIYTDEVSYLDDQNINITQMLDALASHKGRSYTACPSIETWLKAFEGADTIYIGTITSKLSGTYNSAVAAKNIYLQSHPETKICVFDTLSTGAELRLLMEKLVELDRAGMTFEEICKAGAEYLKTTRLFFSLRSLHNLAQNGRVSKVVAAAVGVLGIRIVATASEEGTIEPIAKCRGDKRVVEELLNQLEKAGFRSGKIRLGHTENPGFAQTIFTELKKRYPKADILLYQARGLCSYYSERGAIFVGIETA